ncbi:phytanoyl-CoA dioxygenase family protein [Actinobacteria bacterium IMCC26103]|nr:phytanoyl-CoA dioxygenase family protein [Actinobacteria bacterium IMCC26103]
MIKHDYLHQFEENGLFRVDGLLTNTEVETLRILVDELMTGKKSLAGMFFQRDPNSSDYQDVTFDQTVFSGPSLNYRKIKDLEYIPEFLAAVQNKQIKSISNLLIGEEVSAMRTMVVNKPSRSKTPLPWHQDISASWPMSMPPILTVWIALDEVDEENGCVEWLSGSHKLGEIDGGHLTSESSMTDLLSKHEVIKGVLKPGDAIVFDNGVIHRSNPNLSGRRRRGLTICLMHAETFNTKTNTFYPKIFGLDALTPQEVSTLAHVPLNRPIDYGE